jgi:hypothetical protein
MHNGAFNWVLEKAPNIPNAKVLDIGGRDVNGTVRRIFDTNTYICVDLQSGMGVDVVADGATYVPPWTPDIIVCCEVLEHARCPVDIINHAARLLSPGGWLLLTAATSDRTPHGSNGGGLDPGEYYLGVSPLSVGAWLLDGQWDYVEITTSNPEDVYARARRSNR